MDSEMRTHRNCNANDVPMRRRDKGLIRELMFRLENIQQLGALFSVTMYDEEFQVPGYTVDEIYEHLQQINRAGYVLQGDSGPMTGIGFGGFTELGNDYLDEEHEKLEMQRAAEAVPQSALDQIRAEIAELRTRLGAIESNEAKAEIEADLDHLAIESDRPAPKRSSLRSFFSSLRESLIRTTTQEGVHQAIVHLEEFLRMHHWL